ncbi:hypothetical protein M2451_003556 [Dysgonomonas sp. PFB1-18]|uniref:hypothetical protein n=1 Tax=unclassified Dysgonomonas TaxID=2630389 RepID=UPI00247709CD|nr:MULTISPECIES: hypothetical protein [unclassified Dysgonomonas]MDH6310677.1 hypothetical protein [Dysgonomonas sp. PF1-14]MDH6340528.1 hypothetical protein [Dysgonomonas sp. PF1-16]MDH6382216.1 hypothetical protein [Dysgonomonas sp. PFB1-18]MDH6399559.1 hypothetical protein [Dysgonomonas sp. PF1-23]
MKNYKEYISIKADLINAILVKLPCNVLDISFDYDEKSITLQIVLLSNTNLDDSFFRRVDNLFNDYEVVTKIIHISKEKFNENMGGWIPSGYTWLKYNLLSKAEVL